jgi:hypothetical protein
VIVTREAPANAGALLLRLLLPLALVLIVLFQVRALNEPLSMDEAMYFIVAGSNELPYVEFVDHKPP